MPIEVFEGLMSDGMRFCIDGKPIEGPIKFMPGGGYVYLDEKTFLEGVKRSKEESKKS